MGAAIAASPMAINTLGALTLAAISASGQRAFNGTWRANNQSLENQGSNQYSLRKGIWRCDTCVPKIAIKADGHDHRVNSSLYYCAPKADMESVHVLNDHSIEITDKLSGKVVATNKLTASDDGKTLTTDWKTISENGKESRGKFDSERVGVAQAGVNKVSGNWRPERTNTSEDVITVTYNVTADGLAMSAPTGESFTAKFDGKEYPFKGDPGITGVSLRKIDENTIEETDICKGRVITVSHMTVGRDGKIMKVTVEDKLRKAKISWTADKL
jgi:hypothetical protein